MTEEEWLTETQPRQLIAWLYCEASDRKQRLYCVAVCRLIWQRITIPSCRAAVDAAESYASGHLDLHQFLQLRHPVLVEESRVRSLQWELGYKTPPWEELEETLQSICLAADLTRRWLGSSALRTCDLSINPVRLLTLLRDIFGNPFRPVAFDPAWRTETAVGIESGIYEERAFERMPILADALQDAGCEHADILTHCRVPGEHVRGCWVVDLVLGKE